MERNHPTYRGVVFCLVAGLLSACSQEPDVEIKLPPDLIKLREELDKGKTQIDAALAALGSITSNPDKAGKTQFDAFTKEVAGLQAQAATIKGRADDMRARGEAYFKTWEEQLAQMGTPEIRKAAEARKEDLAAVYSTLTAEMEKGRDSYQKYLAFLTDSQTIIGNDLNPQGITAFAPKTTGAKDLAAALKKQIDVVESQLAKVAAIYSPGS